VPAEYRQYLFGKPIVATISEIKRNPQPWIKELTLDVGTANGVVPEMKFYAAAPANIYMLVEILDAGEHSSRAYVITSGYRRSERNVIPKVGWRLTSRAPKDASNYYPG
jgi:cell shape-determining protein MreC